jgi:hypothetical protein
MSRCCPQAGAVTLCLEQPRETLQSIAHDESMI